MHYHLVTQWLLTGVKQLGMLHIAAFGSMPRWEWVSMQSSGNTTGTCMHACMLWQCPTVSAYLSHGVGLGVVVLPNKIDLIRRCNVNPSDATFTINKRTGQLYDACRDWRRHSHIGTCVARCVWTGREDLLNSRSTCTLWKQSLFEGGSSCQILPGVCGPESCGTSQPDGGMSRMQKNIKAGPNDSAADRIMPCIFCMCTVSSHILTLGRDELQPC